MEPAVCIGERPYVCGAGFLSSAIPLALWDLLRQALATATVLLPVLLGISTTVVAAPLSKRSRTSPSRVLSNTFWAVRSHSAEFRISTRRSAFLISCGTRLLVGGWDRLTTLYGYGWAETQVLRFPLRLLYMRVLSNVLGTGDQDSSGRWKFTFWAAGSPRDVWDSSSVHVAGFLFRTGFLSGARECPWRNFRMAGRFCYTPAARLA